MRSLTALFIILLIIVSPTLAQHSLRTDGQIPSQPPLTIDVGSDGGRVLINDGSFEFVATTGANMLIDYVSNFPGATPVESVSFSTLKSRY